MEKIISNGLRELGELKNELKVIDFVKGIREKYGILIDYFYMEEIQGKSLYCVVYQDGNSLRKHNLMIDNVFETEEDGE